MWQAPAHMWPVFTNIIVPAEYIGAFLLVQALLPAAHEHQSVLYSRVLVDAAPLGGGPVCVEAARKRLDRPNKG